MAPSALAPPTTRSVTSWLLTAKRWRYDVHPGTSTSSPTTSPLSCTSIRPRAVTCRVARTSPASTVNSRRRWGAGAPASPVCAAEVMHDACQGWFIPEVLLGAPVPVSIAHHHDVAGEAP